MELDELAERIERACADINPEGRAAIIHVLQEAGEERATLIGHRYREGQYADLMELLIDLHDDEGLRQYVIGELRVAELRSGH